MLEVHLRLRNLAALPPYGYTVPFCRCAHGVGGRPSLGVAPTVTDDPKPTFQADGTARGGILGRF